MSMTRREGERQQELWIATRDVVAGPGHPFYLRLNKLLADHGFDRFVEGLCQRFYAERLGRPSIPPGVYFRMLMVGYFEGIDSERGIAWRCADSLGLREFLGYCLRQKTPDHSSLSIIRSRLDLESHQEVFCWVLKVLGEKGLLRGKTIGIDATTLEANAALRSIVRRQTGESYEEFLRGLAKASGIETPRREDLVRIDRDRKGKGSNKDWEHPHDPDAKIAKMKDGRTHMAHKAQHAVDIDTSAVVAVTVHGADEGDTTTLQETVAEAAGNLEEVREQCEGQVDEEQGCMEEVVTDKGYHSNGTMLDMAEIEIRSYVSEPKRGRRKWKGKRREQAATYANRRRIKGRRGKALLRRRGEVVERSFAHLYETGAMRRTHLRGHLKILKRLLVHVGGYNLALVMRQAFGIGKPRGLQGQASRTVSNIMDMILSLLHRLCGRYEPFDRSSADSDTQGRQLRPFLAA